MDAKRNHHMLPEDCNWMAGQYGCKLEGRRGALSKLAGAKVSVALFDCGKPRAPPGSVKNPAMERGWAGPIETGGTGADPLVLCYASSLRARESREGMGIHHGDLTNALLEVSSIAPW